MSKKDLTIKSNYYLSKVINKDVLRYEFVCDRYDFRDYQCLLNFQKTLDEMINKLPKWFHLNIMEERFWYELGCVDVDLKDFKITATYYTNRFIKESDLKEGFTFNGYDVSVDLIFKSFLLNDFGELSITYECDNSLKESIRND